MSTVEELRNLIKKNKIALQAITSAIKKIDEFEASVLNQLLSGAVDKVSEISTKQKLEQVEVSREDKKALLEEEARMIQENHAATEELINIYRNKVGMPLAPISNLPPVSLDNEDDTTKPVARPQKHPGTVPPIVIGARNNK